MTKKIFIMLALVILLTVITGCQNRHSEKEEAVTGDKFVLPPFTKITLYVDGKKMDLKKNDPKVKKLSGEIYKGVINITDAVGGNRTFRPVGFEGDPKVVTKEYLKDTVLIFAEWDKRHNISSKQKEMTLGHQGWEGTPKDKDGNYIINTDGFLVEIYKPNLDSHFGYKKWSDGIGVSLKKPEEPVYWAYVEYDSLNCEKLLNIIVND
ncbi:hypothetical protein Dtox_0500 [Desulfofarcimen acetoxidans DSM 771]|uniref:Lipoprotein n=2 Tax=Desulfofarcimen acetoxidans TaxID=58138 RepID=C8W5W8_DESAS|nr:hypothetical protein Dtox_0500 [Desulfofarcimen acetoxidans DSM 771]